MKRILAKIDYYLTLAELNLSMLSKTLIKVIFWGIALILLVRFLVNDLAIRRDYAMQKERADNAEQVFWQLLKK
jgi:uncharacterized membrane protein